MDVAGRPSRRRNRAMLWLFAWGALLIVLVAGHSALLTWVGGWLVHDAPLPNTPIVAVNASRVHSPAALDALTAHASSSAAARVLIIENRPPHVVRRGFFGTRADWLRQKLLKRGVNRAQLRILAYGETERAYDEESLLSWLDARPETVVNVVCPRLETRHCREILDRALKARSSRVGTKTLPAEPLDETNWWRSRAGLRIFLRSSLDNIHASWVGAKPRPAWRSPSQHIEELLEAPP